jgi:hypothetical protein
MLSIWQILLIIAVDVALIMAIKMDAQNKLIAKQKELIERLAEIYTATLKQFNEFLNNLENFKDEEK